MIGLVLRTALAVALAPGLLLAACTRASQTGAVAAKASPQTDYLAPPELQSAVRQSSGDVVLAGVGSPDALIRLGSPDGSAIGVAASHSGAWSLTAPAADEPRLYSLSGNVGGRVLRARGYLAISPAPGAPVAVLRPGEGALTLGGGQLSISSVDFDRSGAAAASGIAAPGQIVRLALDGREDGEDRADAADRFAASLAQAVRPGPHILIASSPTAQASVSFNASKPAALAQPPFAVVRAADAWRIDWITPGGGLQSTILFDPQRPGA